MLCLLAFFDMLVCVLGNLCSEIYVNVMKHYALDITVNRGGVSMLAEKPIKIKKVEKKFLDREILRLAIIAELDAVNLYEQLAAATENEAIREVLLDVAREEKAHVGEFQTLLLREDAEQVEELEHGKKEVEEELGI
jgi:rubrerythrin